MIIKRPIVTEKAILAQNKGKYAFIVDFGATKDQVKSHFQSLFGVKAIVVNMYVSKGKVKTNWKTRAPIFKPNTKKAIVTIKPDQKIDLLTLKNDK